DAEVDVVVVDDVLALDVGVEPRELLQAQYDGAAEEAHQAQADAVQFLELLFVAAADLLEVEQVHLVKGGEDGGGLLCLDEALGDLLADLTHRYALDAAGVEA